MYIYNIYVYIYVCTYVYMYIYIYVIYIYIQKLKSEKQDVLEWILNRKAHFQFSQIFWLFYITFYSVCE